ncbi:MAG TPA: S41 family peptidase [Gemmataceae bacterium]|nr:S41 family peptidase [Gemmataceae bacterium]
MNPATPDPDLPRFQGITPSGLPSQPDAALRRIGPMTRPRGRRPILRNPLWRYSLAGVVLIGVFSLGVVTDRAGWVPRTSDEEPAYVAREKTFAPFWETWNLVHEYYVDQKSVNDVKMTREAIAGMLDSLGDEGHTLYLSPEQAQRENEVLRGHMDGIGATISVREHVPIILYTLPDSPARKAGLKANDILLKVDDKAVGQESLQGVVDQIRGPAGTQVHLTVQRDAQPEPIQMTITRGQVVVPDVSWRLLPGEPYAHIALRSFGEHADEQLRAALAAARQQGAKGVIFDMRGNPGGYKDQAVKVASEFIGSGNVFIEKDMHGKETPVPVESGGTALDLPMAVLIDGGSASAAEICAGALQDHKRAKLVGQKSFGTGTVLQPFELSDGSELHLATLQWLTPDGHEIWHHGIEPDVKVVLKDESEALLPDMEDNLTAEALQKSSDAQLLKALEVLREQTTGKTAAN